MQWEEVAEEEVKKLKFASRHSGKDSIYADLLEAVKGGRTIKLTLDPGVTPKAMSQRLYTAAKAVDLRVTCRTLDDKTGIVISLDTSAVPVIEPAPGNGTAAAHQAAEGDHQTKKGKDQSQAAS